jgi:transcription termination factor Rho
MNIQELKLKSSEQLITQAEELGIENASTLRKQEILFCNFKKGCRKRGNYWGWCSTTITRWFWFFKSNGVKLFTRTR